MVNDYQTYNLKTVEENVDIFIDQCNQLYKIIQENDIKDTTWQYKEYNLFSLSSSSEAFWFLWKNIQVCIRKTIGDDRPAWMTGWLNYHKYDEVLDWHNHLGSKYHGYISIDPKVTKTMFESDDCKYEIENLPGLLYIGPSARLHKVEALEPFEGHRITIAFDVTTEKDVFSAKAKEFNWIPVY
jgi:hypothetical protein